MSRASAHDLYNRAALVRVGGVTQLVDKLHNGVHSRIIAYGVFRALYIVVDGSGNANAGNTCLGQVGSSPERAVAADDNNARHVSLFADLLSLENVFPILELLAARGEYLRAAALNDVGNVSRLKLHHVAVKQPVISAAYADDF